MTLNTQRIIEGATMLKNNVNIYFRFKLPKPKKEIFNTREQNALKTTTTTTTTTLPPTYWEGGNVENEHTVIE